MSEWVTRPGLPVAVHAHAHASDAVADAVAARVDSIEHCSFMAEEGIDDRPDLIEAIAAAGITVSLTLGVRRLSTATTGGQKKEDCQSQ